MCVGGVCAVLIGIALVWILRSGPAIGMNRVPLFIDNHALTVCYRQVAQQIPMLITSAISYQIPSEARLLSNLPYAIISLSNELAVYKFSRSRCFALLMASSISKPLKCRAGLEEVVSSCRPLRVAAALRPAALRFLAGLLSVPLLYVCV